MKQILHLIFLSSLMITGCGESDQTSTRPVKDKVEQSTADTTPLTALRLAPLMKNTDSVQVIYYDNPDGDSLRYARYYKYTNATDSGFLSALKSSLQQPVTSQNDVRHCRSIGKMYLFSNNDPVKTLYFSNREDSCRYLYFIQNGSFVYMELPGDLESALIQKKNISKVP